MIPVNRPLVTEEDVEAILHAAQGGWISGDGPDVVAFEKALESVLDIPHAVAVSSGTTACDLVVEALEIGQGDQVISPALTIVSTVSAAVRRGAQLTLVDADPDTWCMKANETIDQLTDETALVFPVHIFGLPVDMDPILNSAQALGVPVIEDAAEALGVSYRGRPCGSLGSGAVFSFYANKTVTGGEGGAVVTGDSNLAQAVRSLRNLCFEPEERFVHRRLGFNGRMPNLVAALAASQVKRLESLVAHKRRLGARYLAGLNGHPWLQLPVDVTEYAENSYWVFGVVLLDDAPVDAPELQVSLRNIGVDTRRFFCPLNLQPILRELECVSHEPMPVAERLWERGLYLPSGVGTTDAEIDMTIEALWRQVK